MSAFGKNKVAVNLLLSKFFLILRNSIFVFEDSKASAFKGSPVKLLTCSNIPSL